MPKLSLPSRRISTLRGGPQELAGDWTSNRSCREEPTASTLSGLMTYAAGVEVFSPSSGDKAPGAEGVEALDADRPPSTLLGGDCSPEEVWLGCTRDALQEECK